MLGALLRLRQCRTALSQVANEVSYFLLLCTVNVVSVITASTRPVSLCAKLPLRGWGYIRKTDDRSYKRGRLRSRLEVCELFDDSAVQKRSRGILSRKRNIAPSWLDGSTIAAIPFSRYWCPFTPHAPASAYTSSV